MRPHRISSDAKVSEYAALTHSASVVVSSRSCTIVGIATLTTVASRMIIETPRARKTSAAQRLRPVRTVLAWKSVGALMVLLRRAGQGFPTCCRDEVCRIPGMGQSRRARALRPARRARPDGRDHQSGLPVAGARVGACGRGRSRRRHVRVGDGHLAGPRRAQCGVARPRDVRPGRGPPGGPALRGRPGHGRGRGAAAGRRGPGRPRRPQLRLPGAQGHPQGRRQRAAVEARPVPRHRPRRHRGGRRPRAGVGQDADRHRRRPPHLPRRRPDGRPGGRGVGRPARPHGGPDVRRHGRLVGHRPAQGGARRRSARPSSATATSGPRPTRCAWSSRRAPTASSSAAAAWAGRGCSASWRPPSPASPIPDDPALPVVLATLRRHAQLLVDDYGELKGCRDIRKHMAWYLKGFSVRQPIRQALGTVASLAELDDLLAQIDADQVFNTARWGRARAVARRATVGRRCRTAGSTRRSSTPRPRRRGRGRAVRQRGLEPAACAVSRRGRCRT